jgi:hypothetical protein
MSRRVPMRHDGGRLEAAAAVVAIALCAAAFATYALGRL